MTKKPTDGMRVVLINAIGGAEIWRGTFAEFVSENSFEARTVREMAKSIAAGHEYQFGGGASPSVVLRREKQPFPLNPESLPWRALKSLDSDGCWQVWTKHDARPGSLNNAMDCRGSDRCGSIPNRQRAGASRSVRASRVLAER